MTYESAIDRLCDIVRKKLEDYWDRQGFTMPIPQVKAIHGPKWTKIVRCEQTSQNVHCFVNKETGNIHKAASFRAAEKRNPRGNIYDEVSVLRGVTQFSVVYLR